MSRSRFARYTYDLRELYTDTDPSPYLFLYQGFERKKYLYPASDRTHLCLGLPRGQFRKTSMMLPA